MDGTNVVLTFWTVGSVHYDVQATTDLVSGAWSIIATNLAGTYSTMTYTDVGAAIGPQRYYRLHQQ